MPLVLDPPRTVPRPPVSVDPPCRGCLHYKPESKQCLRVLAWVTAEKGHFASASRVVGTLWCKPDYSEN